MGQQNARWINHRIAAHRMHRRGQSLDTIADHLRVSTRSVSRYLALPCPERLSTEPVVNLEDFYLEGRVHRVPGVRLADPQPGCAGRVQGHLRVLPGAEDVPHLRT